MPPGIDKIVPPPPPSDKDRALPPPFPVQQTYVWDESRGEYIRQW
jgi:hypothetical protein